MLWRIVVALIEIARIVAARVAEGNAEQSAAAKIFLKQMERMDAAIAKAEAARAGANRGADGRFVSVRDPDPHSRD